MRFHNGGLSLSATDLSAFLGCRHRTGLDKAAAYGQRPRPYEPPDPLLELLWKRGLEHEASYVNSLRTEHTSVLDLSSFKSEPAAHLAKTREAMRDGISVIVQGALGSGRWFGHPDIMQRVDAPSTLGAWSYEIADTKLARETRGGTILQLGLYSEMLGEAQGVRPERFYVITPDPVDGKREYRTDDYAAYFRLIRAQMEQVVALPYEEVLATYYPEPVDLCEICAWRPVCNDRRRADDHLSFVAGISRVQRRELVSNKVATLAALAAMALPLSFKPERGSADGYERIREQARLQFQSRGKTPPDYEMRPLDPGIRRDDNTEEAPPVMGLCRLPEPSPGDLFLDLEGDQYAADGGREYLFGLVSLDAKGAPSYQAYWAFNEHEERVAFEAVMDTIARAAKAHPGMHVYHYAAYEQTAFKRLMGRYATREDQLDSFLRSGRFIDLYCVVRQGLIAGIERYSIKNLEVFYDFTRDVDLGEANRNLRRMEYALEVKAPEMAPPEVRQAVEGYNRDDCVSTLRLRDWLEGLRAQMIAGGTDVPRPIEKEAEPPAELDEKAQRVAELRARLLAGVSEVRAERTEEQQARWLLAYMLDWHRREDKAGWWEYYRLRDLPEDDLYDEPDALAGLELVERVEVVLRKTTTGKPGRPTGSVIDRYRYPAQEMEIARDDELKLLQDRESFGKVVAVDRAARTLDVRKGPTRAEMHPSAVFAHAHVGTEVIEKALFQLGTAVASDGEIGEGKAGSLNAARDLLMRRPPRLLGPSFPRKREPRGAENETEEAVSISGLLDETCLAIQGPPGAGKTYTGARMILALVKAGKRVGVAATGQKVIRNLLDAVGEEAAKARIQVALGHKDKEGSSDGPAVRFIKGNDESLAALQSGAIQVLGGTAWLWSREEFANAVDVLFVDEAGQMSLANVLAVSGAAKSVVLLGDPQQLEQPLKGSHPEGVDASALAHVLGEHKTIPSDRGIFLPITWRMHPSICAFTSETFYERRLNAQPGLEQQRLVGVPDFSGSGLWMVPVEHDDNRNSSDEEAVVVADLVDRLVRAGSSWIDGDGITRPMTGADILVVAPFNAHVTRVTERLRARGFDGVQVGTVDKFQGRQAPVVIYTTATSRPEDAPRGMEFLYSLNRLNVATSRAKCAAILVANPRLFEPGCQTPRQMKLANAFCRYREISARPLPP